MVISYRMCVQPAFPLAISPSVIRLSAARRGARAAGPAATVLVRTGSCLPGARQLIVQSPISGSDPTGAGASPSADRRRSGFQEASRQSILPVPPMLTMWCGFEPSFPSRTGTAESSAPQRCRPPCRCPSGRSQGMTSIACLAAISRPESLAVLLVGLYTLQLPECVALP